MTARNAPTVGGEPRAFLLPPEAAVRQKERRSRRLSLLVLALVVVLVGGGYGYAVSLNANAQNSLDAANAQAASIKDQRAKYSEAAKVASLVADVKKSRTLGASTEVLWADLIDEIRGSLPSGALIQSATMTARAPWEPELTPAGPLRQARVATITIVISSPTILDATEIVRSLVDVPGFADATPDSVSQADDLYSTTVTLNVNEDALSNRFADEEEAAK